MSQNRKKKRANCCRIFDRHLHLSRTWIKI